MLQLKFHIMALCLVLVASVWADRDTPQSCHPRGVPCAPQNPGSALILYNSHRSVSRDPIDQRQFDHSIPAMQIFRAALQQERSYLLNTEPLLPFGQGLTTDANVIPPINPRLTMVTVLDVTNRGIDTDLRAWANANLSGRELQIFNELYNAGNPLSYWSQVYDLRYIQEFWLEGAQNRTNLSEITTSGNIVNGVERNDLAYFRAFMLDGGGIYIQAADSAFETRNTSITATINALTRNNVSRSWGDASGRIGAAPPTYARPESSTPAGNVSTNFWFNNNAIAENFATDFNDLNALQVTHPMRWVRVGGVAHAQLDHAIPLVSVGSETGRAVKVFWDRNGLQEEYQNGRLIVSYGITAFRDHEDGNGEHQTRQGWTRATRTTLAMVQNLYDLMSGTQRYTISKSFVQPDRSVGDEGTIRISVRNPNNYPFELTGGIRDELSTCLRYIQGSSTSSFVNIDGNSSPAAITEQHNGQNLHWTPNTAIPLRSDWVIEFRYRVDNSDCNN